MIIRDIYILLFSKESSQRSLFLKKNQLHSFLSQKASQYIYFFKSNTFFSFCAYFETCRDQELRIPNLTPAAF